MSNGSTATRITHPYGAAVVIWKRAHTGTELVALHIREARVRIGAVEEVDVGATEAHRLDLEECFTLGRDRIGDVSQLHALGRDGHQLPHQVLLVGRSRAQLKRRKPRGRHAQHASTGWQPGTW
jgi:hypothetical protein